MDRITSKQLHHLRLTFAQLRPLIVKELFFRVKVISIVRTGIPGQSRQMGSLKGLLDIDSPRIRNRIKTIESLKRMKDDLQVRKNGLRYMALPTHTLSYSVTESE